jgi:hypothetical protein
VTKAKRKPVGRVIVGGVNAVEQQRATLAHSVSATIEKRRDEKFRLRLRDTFDVVPGQRLLIEIDWLTTLAIVASVHPFGLVDVIIRGGERIEETAHAVKLRRAPI